MRTTKSFAIDTEVYKKLKAFAAYQGCAIGEAIKILLDCQDIPAPTTGPGYAEWLRNLHEVAKEQGEGAAVRSAKENPYRVPVDGE